MRPLPLALLLLGALTATAAASEGAHEPPSVDALVARLQSPVNEEALREVLAEDPFADPPAARQLARALGLAGGRAAASHLVLLLRHPDPGVREVALRAAGHVGLRLESLAEGVRRAARSPRVTERRAALRALGRVGDGRDVPLLLEVAASPNTEPSERAAAFDALGTLSGVSIPALPGRWEAWWRVAQALGRPDLERALAGLEGPDGVEAAAYRDVLVRRGWLDVVAVRDAARRWLVQPDPALRAEACRLVEALALADLATDVMRARVFDLHDDYAEESEAALGALGLVSLR